MITSSDHVLPIIAEMEEASSALALETGLLNSIGRASGQVGVISAFSDQKHLVSKAEVRIQSTKLFSNPTCAIPMTAY